MLKVVFLLGRRHRVRSDRLGRLLSLQLWKCESRCAELRRRVSILHCFRLLRVLRFVVSRRAQQGEFQQLQSLCYNLLDFVLVFELVTVTSAALVVHFLLLKPLAFFLAMCINDCLEVFDAGRLLFDCTLHVQAFRAPDVLQFLSFILVIGHLVHVLELKFGEIE